MAYFLNDNDDRTLWLAVMNNDREAFSVIFDRYYRNLVLFCGNFIANPNVCEDIVQNIFVKLWVSRRDIDIGYLRTFLLRSVRNACLNEAKHLNVRYTYEKYSQWVLSDVNTNIDGYIFYSDLENNLTKALESLAPQYREVFVENRLNGKSCHEIAENLQISERTVEERLRKALKALRNRLMEFNNDKNV